MLSVIYLILLVFGLACFVLAALNKPVRNYNLIACGLAFWVLVSVIQTFHGM